MKISLTLLGLVGTVFLHAQAPQKSFTEKLDGIKTSGKELTKNNSTDNSSVGQSGVMSTSVPLVNITSRTMSFPLNLQYSSGITVDQSSGPVGLGWILPIGSIVRDYGAFEPDYTSTTQETKMLNSNDGYHTGWMETPNGVSVDPSLNKQYLGYDAVSTSAMTVPMSDEYHVTVPGFLSNTFWNGGTPGAFHQYDWKLTTYERLKILASYKTFTVSQEFSRINELNNVLCSNCNNTDAGKENFDKSGSYAAAIGMLPYVINGKVYYPTPTSGTEAWIPANRKVEYEDFNKFSITDENGVVYVFGRPLRGQKYVISDDPYWSTRAGTDQVTKVGNFWKIDFIAEWLLTEIHALDYDDANENGIADDGDEGDWIRFDYTAPTKTDQSSTPYYGAAHDRLPTEVPMHRTWSSYSQTDQASSLMREVAYLTKIVTPVSYVDFTISPRMDVEHDFYSKPANTINNGFYYEDRRYHTQVGTAADFDVQFPVETMKYESLAMYSTLKDKTIYPTENFMTSKIAFKYAAQGGPDELAVSSYLIRDNSNNDKLIDKPSDTNPFNIEAYKSTTVKRGKTTLLGLDFYNASGDADEVSSYKFEYAYNPSYDEIHKREIVRRYLFPSLRQSYPNGVFPTPRSAAPINYTESVLQPNGTSYTTATYLTGNQTGVSPYDFLIDFPYQEKYYKWNNPSASHASAFVVSGTTPALNTTWNELLHPLKPVKDVYGYFFAEDCPTCPTAWSLTKITYPTGGQVSFEYEQGEFNKTEDNTYWSVKENAVPLIKDYNDLAKERSMKQDLYNRFASSMYSANNQSGFVAKTLTAAYEVPMPANVGIRLSKKITNDRINPTVEVRYTYDEGHFTSLPSAYLANYIQGFNSFIMREQLRHDWEKTYYPSLIPALYPAWKNDYDEKTKYAAISNINLDDYASTHFYESVSSILSDNSKTKTYYGSTAVITNPNDPSPMYLKYKLFCSRLPSADWSGRYILGSNQLIRDNVVLTKNEFYEAAATTPYRSETFTYQDYVIDQKKVEFNFSLAAPPQYVYLDGSTVVVPPVVPAANSITLWANTFELWLPINGVVTPRTYYTTNSNFINTGPFHEEIDPNATSWTTVGTSVLNTASFVYDVNHFVVRSGGLSYNTSENNYVKWGTFARVLKKKESNYKGFTSSVEYTYHPTQYYLQQEKTESLYQTEKYITVYEYANETYNGITSVFTARNTLRLPTRTTVYLGSVANSNALSAEMTTYDYSSSLPRPKHSYRYLTTSMNANTGAFTVVPYNISSSSNPNWKMEESDLLEFNELSSPIASRKDLLFEKDVMGYNLGLPKAGFAYPDRKFDATYSGFDDLYGKYGMSSWNQQSYLKENWFTNETELKDISAKVSVTNTNAGCSNASSFTTSQGTLYYVVSVDDVSNLHQGDNVAFSYVLNNSTTTINATITSITPKANLTGVEQALNYILCFNVSPLPNANVVVSTPKISYTVPYYRVSKTYSRTGNYSYKLPTIRTSGETAKKTPIRPVKMDQMTPDAGCTFGGSTNPTYCYWTYEASMWLRYDLDIPTATGTPPPIVKSTEDDVADAIYQRGTVTTTNNNQGIKIICEVWNSTRTSMILQKIFYAESVNNSWKQYTVSLPIFKGPQQWLDVYVVNENSQLNTPIVNLKSVFVDDILIYPQNAKYDYSVFDAHSNITQIVNNNDVIRTNVYDDWGRMTSAVNEYGKVVHENKYFISDDWSHKNNYVNEKLWVANGKYTETRTYLDGFGKSKQSIIADVTRNTRIVSGTTIYNNKGQLTKMYKSYALNGSNFSEAYNDDYAPKTLALYGSNLPYTTNEYEAKPENAISATSAPRLMNEAPVVSTQTDYATTVQLQDPLGAVYPAGQLIVRELTNAIGNKTKTYINNLGRVVMEEHEIGYDHTQQANGSILFTTTGMQVSKTWFYYDATGRLLKVIDPDGKQKTFTYNSLGQVLKVISPDQGTSEMRYDNYDRLRFSRNQKDIAAIQTNAALGTDQLKYTKYDVWNRVIESGVILCPLPGTYDPGNITFPTQIFFNDPAIINDQTFPMANQKLTQVHVKFEYGNSRSAFNSLMTTRETVYGDHTLNATFNYVPSKEDKTSFEYMADGQMAITAYEYTGLSGIHKVKQKYNELQIPVGKEYLHPTQGFYSFQWQTELDNFGRAAKNFAMHNNVETQTGGNYYDMLGNLVMTGLGATGNTASPHLDYIVERKNIRDETVTQMSRSFRFGLKYNPLGNITDQYWSNEHFDPTTNTNALHINQYNYTYDKMNRLVGADYLETTMATNYFQAFNSVNTTFPANFNCGVNVQDAVDYLQPTFDLLQINIGNGVYVEWSKNSINALNILLDTYKSINVSYSTMNQKEQDKLYNDYLSYTTSKKVDPFAYEYYMATMAGDQQHLNDLDNNPKPDTKRLKYTKSLMALMPLNATKDCLPNPGATVYGFLQEFPFPTTMSSSNKYDAAYWYTQNGNITQLNRNDDAGLKRRQDYIYQNSLDNQLDQVNWTVETSPPTTTNSIYNYDLNGNLVSDAHSNISSIKYTAFNNLPASMTNTNGERKYRYSAGEQRTVKDINTNDKEFYIDDVILNQNGVVKSYATPEGYAVPNVNNQSIAYFYYVKDWLGTTRSIIDGNGTALNATDHYPYGKRMPGRSFVSDNEGNRYQFTGHEFDGETGYEYHGARYYNNELARYMSVDPKAKYHESPYVYAGDNPVWFIDINGEDTVIHVYVTEVAKTPEDVVINAVSSYKSEQDNKGQLVIHVHNSDGTESIYNGFKSASNPNGLDPTSQAGIHILHPSTVYYKDNNGAIKEMTGPWYKLTTSMNTAGTAFINEKYFKDNQLKSALGAADNFYTDLQINFNIDRTQLRPEDVVDYNEAIKKLNSLAEFINSHLIKEKGVKYTSRYSGRTNTLFFQNRTLVFYGHHSPEPSKFNAKLPNADTKGAPYQPKAPSVGLKLKGNDALDIDRAYNVEKYINDLVPSTAVKFDYKAGGVAERKVTVSF